MAKQDAVQRACEMFNAPGNQVPQLAREYANALCRKYGGCSEVKTGIELNEKLHKN